jgi:hypothetical protein
MAAALTTVREVAQLARYTFDSAAIRPWQR